ncbi:MAG: hypothetical protein M3Y55_12080 [Pseudomonadota bacterium]|nr:hypothetical protein [Pseudomonadota bacterium]
MSRQPEAAPSSAVYVRPLPFVRRASDRRIEVFSPKMARRLSLTSYAAWQLWLALEANPAVSTFCERPTFIAGSPRRIIDFWVRFNRQGCEEFWLLDDSDESSDGAESAEAGAPSTVVPAQVRDTPVRLIPRRSLLRWSAPVANWAQIVPHLVTWRRFADPVLAQSIVVYLGQSRTLDDVLERFSEHDGAMTEAALYSLVANGRVLSSDLSTSPLSGSTRFRRA